MAYKQGFLSFSALALILVFWGLVPLIASAAPSASCSVLTPETGSPNNPDDLPMIKVFNEIVGGPAQLADFTINVMDDDHSIQSQSGLIGGNDFTVKSGSFQVNTSQLNYGVEKPVCPNGNQVNGGDIVTYIMVSTYQDHIAPIITLVGDATVNLTVGDSYDDAGATALDNVDGDITTNVATVNPVDTNVVGTYTVAYNVSDVAGNHAVEVTRTVNVAAAPADNLPSTHRSGSSGGRRLWLGTFAPPVTGGLVLGAGTFNWDLLTAAERAELIAPFRQQLILFLLRLQVFLHR